MPTEGKCRISNCTFWCRMDLLRFPSAQCLFIRFWYMSSCHPLCIHLALDPRERQETSKIVSQMRNIVELRNLSRRIFWCAEFIERSLAALHSIGGDKRWRMQSTRNSLRFWKSSNLICLEFLYFVWLVVLVALMSEHLFGLRFMTTK